MASLSYYTNWETTHGHHLNFFETSDDDVLGNVMTSSPPFFLPQPETVVGGDEQLGVVPAELLFGFDDPGFVLPPGESHFDSFFNSEEITFSDNCVSLEPAPAPLPEYSFPQELEFQAYAKRQKLCHVDHFPEITQNCFGVFIPNPPLLQDFKPPPQPLVFPELSSGPFLVYSAGTEAEAAVVKKNDAGNGGGKTLSAQSIAARERRRKITEKTQELGKLIPGGQKMNTAEMFQSAYKYIKYMQAQVSVLQSCQSAQEKNGERYMNEELESLVGSLLIQEKLYSNEKFLVPEKFIQSLPNAHELFQAIKS